MRRKVSNVILALLCLSVVAGPGTRAAFAQATKARAEIEAKSKAAMESYDMLDFAAAKQQLGEALAIARKAGLSGDPVVARVHLNLGVLYFAGLKDEEAAITAFADAVKIDPSIEVDLGYRTDQMAAALADVKKQGGAGGAAATGSGCGALDGLEHELVDTASAGQALEISAQAGGSLGADKVVLYFRAPGAVKFTQVAMARGEGCSYRGSIPASAVTGSSLHYYVAALRAGESVASRGSSGSPNIIELGGGTGAVSGGGDAENPLGSGGSTATLADDPVIEKRKRIFVAVALGTGAGAVSGQTEVAESDVDCSTAPVCFAPALLHVFPEVGYYFSRQTSASLAFRMGFALGANVDGHATAAPAVLARLRYALRESGDGVVVSGAVGGGIIRHTVKVEDAPASMNTDTTASGPFLLGAGVGYLKPMSGALRLVCELNGLAAIPGGIKTIGTCPGAGCVKPHVGFQFDLNLGLLVAF